MSSKIHKTFAHMTGGMLALSALLLCVSANHAETQHVVISGLGVLKPDWDSAIYFRLYSPTLDGYDTVTITNYRITGAGFTFADGNGTLTNQSPSAVGDVTATLTTGAITNTYTPTEWPEAKTVTGIDTFTLQDSTGDVDNESIFFNTFWVWKSVSTISFDVNVDATGVGPDPLNPDLFFITLGNCNWPPDTLPTNAPDGISILSVPITSSNPAFETFTTQAGTGDTSDLPNDTNYPGITTTPEPSPAVPIGFGVACLAGLAVRMRFRTRTG